MSLDPELTPSPMPTFARAWGQVLAVGRSPAFWRSQVMVVVITILRYAATTIHKPSPFTDLSDVVIFLYAIPIIYASMTVPSAGGLITALICLVFSLPVVFEEIIDHGSDSLDWLAELTYQGTSPVIALVISRAVRLREAEHLRAQEMMERLASLRQQVIQLSIQAQERERGRIARELHDETIQSLISLCQGLDRLVDRGTRSGRAVESVMQLRTLAEHTVDEVRRLSRDLRPSLLDSLGLVAAVEWLVAGLAETQGIRAELRVTGRKRRLPAETELHLFRIVQEALSNVAKHSAAMEVTVYLEFGDGQLTMRIHDDGVGFAPVAAPGDLLLAGKLGLAGMRERASLIGAELRMESVIGHGTRVTVVHDYAPARHEAAPTSFPGRPPGVGSETPRRRASA